MARPLQSLWLRQGIVVRLRDDATLLAIGDPPISEGDQPRIYGRRRPAELFWPFVGVSVADEGPLRKGTTVRVTIHTFSKDQFDDECETMNSVIQTSLEDAVLDLSSSVKATISWVSSQVIPDAAEANAWHGLNSFTATIG